MRQQHLLNIGILFLLFPVSSWAKETFELHVNLITLEDISYSKTKAFSQRANLFESVNVNRFESLLSTNINNYDKLDGTLKIQGVEYQFQSDAKPGSNPGPAVQYKLTLKSACLPQDKVFITDQSRNDGLQQMIGWLQQGSQGLKRACLSEKSPVDPVAGNPLSLMSTMLESDFAISSQNSPRNPIQRKTSFRLVPEMGQHTANGFHYASYTVPASVILPMAQPRNHLVLSMPVTQVDNNGSITTSSSIGAHLQRRMHDNWQITSGVRVGYVDSDSYQASASMYSASVNNTFFILLDNINLSVHQLLSAHRANKNPFSDYQTEYQLENQSMKTALRAEGSLNLHIFGSPGSWDAIVADTRFFGDKLYMEHYQDLALSIGARRRVGSGDWQAVRGGLTYTQGQHGFQGYKINFGYFF
ncbi:MAG: hypothetical protein OEW58_12850 [Gammaproteobacteria bacterium]|nr:hypothetical protein [Gammaproteobacteria bacterium]